jgi:hypothetical protein
LQVERKEFCKINLEDFTSTALNFLSALIAKLENFAKSRKFYISKLISSTYTFLSELQIEKILQRN